MLCYMVPCSRLQPRGRGPGGCFRFGHCGARLRHARAPVLQERRWDTKDSRSGLIGSGLGHTGSLLTSDHHQHQHPRAPGASPVFPGHCLTAVPLPSPRLPPPVGQHCSMGNMLLTVHVEDRDGSCTAGVEPPSPSAPLPEPGTAHVVKHRYCAVRMTGRQGLSVAGAYQPVSIQRCRRGRTPPSVRCHADVLRSADEKSNSAACVGSAGPEYVRRFEQLQLRSDGPWHQNRQCNCKSAYFQLQACPTNWHIPFCFLRSSEGNQHPLGVLQRPSAARRGLRYNSQPVVEHGVKHPA